MKLLGDRSVASLLEGVLLVFQVLAWTVVAFFVVLGFVSPKGASVTFPVDVHNGPRQEIEGPGGTWTLETTQIQVSMPVDRASWIGTLLLVLFVGLFAFVGGELRSIFRSLRRGSPFVAANGLRLRRVGRAVLGYEILRVVVKATLVGPTIGALRTTPGSGSIRVDASPNLVTLFLGFAVLVLAEVFRRGAAMDEEQALTV